MGVVKIELIQGSVCDILTTTKDGQKLYLTDEKIETIIQKNQAELEKQM